MSDSDDEYDPAAVTAKAPVASTATSSAKPAAAIVQEPSADQPTARRG
eukprot:CAMPEP_0174876172 /NCGR_PEP_ID=MMETSP1114-20130205/79633_1 /TAXON_ID=312471 /ORGANISM="Neobodo designis, Strain CCAP 1951/1" /LENGTH=47 /DNA_ID= /DNA_START= /DNA_END= /DNA_ORIENTATION=